MTARIFPNVLVKALVYEITAFVILFIITYLWYGQFNKTIQYILLSFVISVAYYAWFHWIFA